MPKVKEKWKVTCLSIWIKDKPASGAKALGCIYTNEIIDVDERSGYGDYWCHHSRGWSCNRDSDGTIIMTCVSKDEEKPPVVDVPPKPAPPRKTEIIEPDPGYLPNFDEYSVYGGSDYNGDALTIKNALGILGLPYQFMPSVDSRLKSNDPAALGRKYAEKIIARIPLLLLTPGKPRFMTNYKKSDLRGALSSILNLAGVRNSTSIDKILGSTGRYYTFEFDSNTYYNYVNPMCRIAARFLGLQNEKLDGKDLDKVDWGKYTKTKIEKFTDIGLGGAVPFYIDSETQINDSFSNGTGESLLASKVNSVSDMSREVNFLLGYGANANGLNFDAMQMEDISDNIENVNSLIDKLLSGNNFLENLSGHLVTVAAGGKLIFPEIWNDSQFSRSYDISIKLTSPDNDKLSVFLNIIVPILHLIAMVAPKDVDNNPNGFVSPFLIRGYYKGLFNCDMGIITSMSITKGAEGGWTKEGLPTVAEINFTIKDLYNVMSITAGNNLGYSTMQNTALMDYIANMCGININKPEVGRQIDMWFTQNFVNNISDTVTKNIWGGIQDSIQTSIMNIYRRF